MPSKNFEEAMKKLAGEVRRGVEKRRPMTPEQKKTLERGD